MPPEPNTLRVGIITDGKKLFKWQLTCLEHLRRVEGVELILIIVCTARRKDPVLGWRKWLHYPWRSALYINYDHDPFNPGSLKNQHEKVLLADVPKLPCQLEENREVEQFGSADVKAIASMRPDVLIRFRTAPLGGEILHVPRYGVWAFHHSDHEHYRGGPTGFWEIWNHETTIGADLHRSTEDQKACIILRKGMFKIHSHSREETVNTVHSSSAVWPAQVCFELIQGRVGAADGEVEHSSAPMSGLPDNITFLKFLFAEKKNKARMKQGENARMDQWNIGVLYQPIATLLDPKCNKNVRWLPDPAKDSYRSSPFGYMVGEKLHVIYEKFSGRKGKSEISRVRPKRDNVLKRSISMLDLEKEVSHPFILSIGDKIYCIPSISENGGVDLYQVGEKNEGLKLVQRLLDEPLVDPTVFNYQGFWWIFGTKAPHTNTALHAYFAKDLLGPYEAHSLNPIKQDIRDARPAGTPFMHEGRLYRPAQDCSLTQGGRIALNEVIELSPSAFRERTVIHLEPMPGSGFNGGIRTISAVGDITLVDGKRAFPESGIKKASAGQPALRAKKK